MPILALDTTMQACSAALLRAGAGDEGLEVFSRFEERERGHAEVIIPMLNEVMGEAGLDYSALTHIAVTIGPGSFTGVRVGVATARGLAVATGAEVTGISSLAVLARRVRDDHTNGDEITAIAADARRGQVYFALFDAYGTPLCDPVAVTPEDAAGLLPAGEPYIFAGTGAELVAAANPRREPEEIVPALQPDAATLARMALGLKPGMQPVVPLYLRPPDAKAQTDHAIARL